MSHSYLEFTLLPYVSLHRHEVLLLAYIRDNVSVMAPMQLWAMRILQFCTVEECAVNDWSFVLAWPSPIVYYQYKAKSRDSVRQ